MANASMLGNMSPQLLKVVERAKQEPEGRFHSLAHLMDVPALERAYRRTRKDAAVGVDGVTKEQYGQDLEQNLQDLHARMKAKRYRHQPIRRVYIPKDRGKRRPIGVSAFEDKLVQDVVREVLEAIYEQDFLDCSHGFRPKRSAHDAVRVLDRIVYRGEVSWILEADIVSFFDSLDRKKLKEMLEVRVVDGSLLRLIGKCLHVGVLEGVELSTSETVRAVQKVLLVDRFQHLTHDVLDQLVLERRDSNGPLLALILRDVDASDRLMAITLRLHPSVQVLEILLQVLPVLLLRDSIHTHRRIFSHAAVRSLQRRHIHQMRQ